MYTKEYWTYVSYVTPDDVHLEGCETCCVNVHALIKIEEKKCVDG
jgi:hypothetical protein